MIRQITRHAQIIQGTDAEVSVALEGSSTETLTIEVSSGGGTCAPSSPIGVPLSSGQATLELTYSASGTPQSYVHTLRAENEQGYSEAASGTVTLTVTDSDTSSEPDGRPPR